MFRLVTTMFFAAAFVFVTHDRSVAQNAPKKGTYGGCMAKYLFQKGSSPSRASERRSTRLQWDWLDCLGSLAHEKAADWNPRVANDPFRKSGGSFCRDAQLSARW